MTGPGGASAAPGARQRSALAEIVGGVGRAILWAVGLLLLGVLIWEGYKALGRAFSDKVPVLGSIPFLGRLFSNKSVSNVSTNLLIFITAKTVSADGGAPEDVFDPRAITATGMSRDELPGFRAPKGTDVFAAPTAPAKK